jgi:hypothetical protein
MNLNGSALKSTLKMSCLVCICFIFGIRNSYAQFGLQLSYIAPAGATAYYFKPAPGAELYFNIGDIDTRFRLGMTVGYYSFRPTRDTFSNYSIKTDYTSSFVPGYDVIQSYTVIPIGVNVEYKLLDDDFSPFVGLQPYFYLIDYVHSYHDAAMDVTNSEETEWQVAMLPKAGIQYKFKDKWLFAAGVGYSLGITGTVDTQNYWKTFLSATYYIDN